MVLTEAAIITLSLVCGMKKSYRFARKLEKKYIAQHPRIHHHVSRGTRKLFDWGVRLAIKLENSPLDFRSAKPKPPTSKD
jgi:hypothetical protein